MRERVIHDFVDDDLRMDRHGGEEQETNAKELHTAISRNETFGIRLAVALEKVPGQSAE